MKPRLRSNEPCPIPGHGFSCSCSGRNPRTSPFANRWGRKRLTVADRPPKFQPRFSNFRPAIQQVEDEHHPNGYRELCNPAEKKRRKHAHIQAQEGKCLLCLEKFESYDEIELCHKESCGMGGSWRDDSLENTFAGHRRCNLQQGSRPFVEGMLAERKSA